MSWLLPLLQLGPQWSRGQHVPICILSDMDRCPSGLYGFLMMQSTLRAIHPQGMLKLVPAAFCLPAMHAAQKGAAIFTGQEVESNKNQGIRVSRLRLKSKFSALI